MVFDLTTPHGQQAREMTASGGLLPGLGGDVSRAWQGTRLESGDGQVVAVEVDDEGRWRLSPQGPGGTVVTVRNRRARTWIGVWAVEGGRTPPGPPEDVTGQVQVEVGPLWPPEEGFAHLQTLMVRNDSPEPILGPLHLVVRLPGSGAGFVGIGRTANSTVLAAFAHREEPPAVRRPDHTSAVRDEVAPTTREQEPPAAGPPGLPWVEVLPGPSFPRSPAPVLGPGQSASVDVRVTGPIDLTAPDTAVRVFRSLHGL